MVDNKKKEYQKEKGNFLSGITGNVKNVFKDIMKSNDPMKTLGPGINSHHYMLRMLCLLFLVLGILHIPVLVSFSNGGFFDSGWIVKLSLGNIGFSKTQCTTEPMITGSTENLSCQTGQITKLVDWSILT